MRAPESLAFALAVLVSSLTFAAGEGVELPDGLGLDAPSVSTATTPPESSPIEHLRWSGTPISLALPVGKDRVLRFPNEVRVGPSAKLTERLQVTSADGAVFLRALEPFEPTLVLVRGDRGTGAHLRAPLRAEAGASAAPIRNPRPAGTDRRGERAGGRPVRCRGSAPCPGVTDTWHSRASPPSNSMPPIGCSGRSRASTASPDPRPGPGALDPHGRHARRSRGHTARLLGRRDRALRHRRAAPQPHPACGRPRIRARRSGASGSPRPSTTRGSSPRATRRTRPPSISSRPGHSRTHWVSCARPR